MSTMGIMKGVDDEATALFKKNRGNSEGKKNMTKEDIGDRILMYIRNGFWVAMAAVVIYYSNFFHHLFSNPKINEIFFEISMTGYTIIVMLIIYTTFVLPLCMGIKSIEEYNPKLIPVGAVVGVIAIISLLIAIWPVWGFWSFPIFIAMWKGFFSLSVFLPAGIFGDILFLVLNTGTVLSFYVIEHEGYFH